MSICMAMLLSRTCSRLLEKPLQAQFWAMTLARYIRPVALCYEQKFIEIGTSSLHMPNADHRYRASASFCLQELAIILYADPGK